MNEEELNTALFEKMEAEQNTYRDWLKSQSPEEVLNHTYEYTIREDILMAMEFNELSEEQAEALLASDTPLADVFKEYQDTETHHMDDIRDCIENRAKYIIGQEKDAVLNTPVYLQSRAYAREHGELETFRASHKANIACKEALEKAINGNYKDDCLDTATVYKDVVGRFGAERVKFVLATTIQHKDWDQRFSRDNRAWAQTVPTAKPGKGKSHER